MSSIGQKKVDDLITKIIISNQTKYEKLSQILDLAIISCNIKKDSYFILGSYALRKIREINDLDIIMETSQFDQFTTCVPFGITEIYNNQVRWFYDLTDAYKHIDPKCQDFSIEIFRKDSNIGFPNNNFSLDSLKTNKGLEIDPNGHPFFSLSTLFKWKTTMGRDKDKDDIVLINNLLQKGGSWRK